MSDVITWSPLLISALALYYSRKTFRRQVRNERRKQVALISVQAITDGIRIINPENHYILRLQVYYHHQWFGTFERDDATDAEPNKSIMMIDFPVVERLRKKWRQEWHEWAKWRDQRRAGPDQPWLNWENAVVDRRLRPRRNRPRKAKYGTEAIAEVFLVDAAGEEWYFNTNRVKLHVPRRAIPKGLFRLALRLRLVGYPPWSGLSPLQLYNFFLGALVALVFVDHFRNEGQGLRWILLLLGSHET
ncbi:MAG TPA: hypothetical protein VFV67_10455 [Actinophytocola sp.]|uniref:hypothetical protein n=1 Tax=Actinophytocola sp. TaxID=1872138 RepID=UPI002DBCF2DE|nr:hypothetical protein [Actinophytocola sp.]HEU5471064.1 hypothetical protein [Actinophytocola sp.]